VVIVCDTQFALRVLPLELWGCAKIHVALSVNILGAFEVDPMAFGLHIET